MNIGAFRATFADRTMSFPGVLSAFVEEGQTEVRLPLQPVEQLLRHELNGLQEIWFAEPLSGINVRLMPDALMPAAFTATALAICWTVTAHVLLPAEHVLPRVEANRAACSTASCSVCRVSIEKHMLAIENSRNVNGSPIIVNSSV